MATIEKSEFLRILVDIKRRIHETQIEVFQNANMSLLRLYYDIGEKLVDNAKWGNGFVERLSAELKRTCPNVKGFSVRNLKSMKKYYSICSQNEKVQTASARIPWSHNMLILDKVKDNGERIWYMNETFINGWSYDVLGFQIKSNAYKRQEANRKLNNFNGTLVRPQSDLANDIMKDPYILDLTGLGDKYAELDLERAMVNRIKNVLMELGSGFSFVGNQYRLEIENKDYYIDLLFYHMRLHCYVVVELKNTEFKPEYVGKMNFYLTIMDEKVKSFEDNPSIGLILCREKDRYSVEYALKRANSPIGVSSYEVGNTLPRELANELPSEEELNLHIGD